MDPEGTQRAPNRSGPLWKSCQGGSPLAKFFLQWHYGVLFSFNPLLTKLVLYWQTAQKGNLSTDFNPALVQSQAPGKSGPHTPVAKLSK